MSFTEHTSISDTFGWTASSVWKKFALDKNGKFENGNLFKEQNIKIRYNEQEIIYSAFRRSNNQRGMNTQIKAYYRFKNNFILKLRKRGSIYTPFIYLNRLEGIETDSPELKQYIVRTNNKTICSQLFKDGSLLDLMASLDLFCIETRKTGKQDEQVLYIEINGIVGSNKNMENSFNLMTRLLDKLGA